MTRILILLVMTVVASVRPDGVRPGRLAFTNVTVSDLTGGPPKGGVTVLIAGGRIAAVGRNVRAPTPEEDIYRIVVECTRDVASNSNGDVPDSIWGIAARAGIDSVYAISLSLQSPPYTTGDFDGDGVSDAAVLVEHRITASSESRSFIAARNGSRFWPPDLAPPVRTTSVT